MNTANLSEKDWLITLLLCLFGGGIGVHRYYVGKVGTGILYTLTLGIFGMEHWLIWSRLQLVSSPIRTATTPEAKVR